MYRCQYERALRALTYIRATTARLTTFRRISGNAGRQRAGDIAYVIYFRSNLDHCHCIFSY